MKKYIKQVRKGVAAFLAVVLVLGSEIIATQAVYATQELGYESEPHFVITKQLYIVTVNSYDGTSLVNERNRLIPATSSDSYYIVSADNSFRITKVGLTDWPNKTYESSNPSVVEIRERVGDSPLYIAHAAGTATITYTSTPDPNQVRLFGATPTVGTMTITIAPYELTLVKAWPGLVQINGDMPLFLTQEEISTLIEFAPPASETRQPTPHPDRRMTDEELAVWIENYRRMGINRSELEILYWTNHYRVNADKRPIHPTKPDNIEQAVEPLLWCPRSSMAARLHSQLMREFRFFAHNDPIYGDPSARIDLFYNNYPLAIGEENIASGQGGGAVSQWLNSRTGHRQNMLARRGAHGVIGIGTDSNSVQNF